MASIFEAIQNFFRFFVNGVSNIINVFQRVIDLLGKCLTYITSFLSILPGWVYAVVIVLVVVCLIYKVLGREGSS